MPDQGDTPQRVEGKGQSPRARRLAEILTANPTITDREALRLAGYSDNTRMRDVTATTAYQDMRAQVEQAARALHLTPERIMRRVRTTLERKGAENDGTSTRAARLLGNWLGMEAPAQVEGRVTADEALLDALRT